MFHHVPRRPPKCVTFLRYVPKSPDCREFSKRPEGLSQVRSLASILFNNSLANQLGLRGLEKALRLKKQFRGGKPWL